MVAYARYTPLNNVVGRSAYIKDKEKAHASEDVLATGGTVKDWSIYAKYEQDHRHSVSANYEGRELMFAIPNSWAMLTDKELTYRVDSLCRSAIGKSTDYEWAIHWNENHTNLHVHLIFSERKLEKPSQTNEKGAVSEFWDRDIYLTPKGTIARRKADRVTDGQGNVLPPIHRKGDPKTPETLNFTIKDKKYGTREWLSQAKETLLNKQKELHARGVSHDFSVAGGFWSDWNAEEYHVCKREMPEEAYEIEKLISRERSFPFKTEKIPYIREIHEGKTPKDEVLQYNRTVRAVNAMLETIYDRYNPVGRRAVDPQIPVSLKTLKAIRKEISKGKVPILYQSKVGLFSRKIEIQIKSVSVEKYEEIANDADKKSRYKKYEDIPLWSLDIFSDKSAIKTKAQKFSESKEKIAYYNELSEQNEVARKARLVLVKEAHEQLKQEKLEKQRAQKTSLQKIEEIRARSKSRTTSYTTPSANKNKDTRGR